MTLTEQQRRELWTASAEAFNTHGGRRPFRIVRAARRDLIARFGWEEIVVTLVVQIIIRLIERWLESDVAAVDPLQMPADFALDPVHTAWTGEAVQ